MSDDKKMNLPEDDSLAELMDNFGGYDPEENADDVDAAIEAQLQEQTVEDATEENIEIELPLIPDGMEDFGDRAVDVPLQDEAVVDSALDGVRETVTEAVSDTVEVIETVPEVKPDKKGSEHKKKTSKKEKDSDGAEKKKDKKNKDNKKDSKDSKKEDKTDKEKSDKKDKKSDKSDKKKSSDNKKTESKKDKKIKVKTEKQKDVPVKEAEETVKPASPMRLVVTLTAICAAVALLLATVNHFTEAKIAANNEAAMLSSIRDIFDESVEAEYVAIVDDPEYSSQMLTHAYLVIKNGNVCGYAASVAPSGFGGPLNLMVGVDSAGEIVGVRVVSMSETPGLGSRVGGDDFLSRFLGKSGQVDVDVISGATISSKAIISGVNLVTSAKVDLAVLAAEHGMVVVPYDANAVVETTAAVTEAPVSEPTVEAEAPVTIAPVTEQAPPDVTKGNSPVQNIVKDPDRGNVGIKVEYLEETAEYETLTTEPESTVSEVTAP